MGAGGDSALVGGAAGPEPTARGRGECLAAAGPGFRGPGSVGRREARRRRLRGQRDWGGPGVDPALELGRRVTASWD